MGKAIAKGQTCKIAALGPELLSRSDFRMLIGTWKVWIYLLFPSFALLAIVFLKNDLRAAVLTK
jgi:hypothetical protein